MFIKQVSVFLENSKGTLKELTRVLGENDVNLLALTIADTAGFGIIRCIVKSDDVDKALEVLKENGYIAKANKVLCVGMPHKPMGLANVLALIEENDISIEYSYSFCRSTLDDAVIIIRPSDKEKCAKLLADAGVNIITQQEVDKF